MLWQGPSGVGLESYRKLFCLRTICFLSSFLKMNRNFNEKWATSSEAPFFENTRISLKSDVFVKKLNVDTIHKFLRTQCCQAWQPHLELEQHFQKYACLSDSSWARRFRDQLLTRANSFNYYRTLCSSRLVLKKLFAIGGSYFKTRE